jgi:hypothetical protein
MSRFASFLEEKRFVAGKRGSVSRSEMRDKEDDPSKHEGMSRLSQPFSAYLSTVLPKLN